MALRHPWFSQTLKRKSPDDAPGSETSSGYGGGGFGVAGTMCGGANTNACDVPQASQPNQTSTSNSNGRATKRLRSLGSRNLERGFAELSIQPTPSVSSSSTHIQHHLEQQSGTQVGEDGVWRTVVGNAGQSSNVPCPDGSTLPPLQSSSVDEPPSPEVDDVQMTTSTWYEPEKDRIIITSLDDEEYDGDDEGQQQRRAGAKSTTQEPEFTISPAFLNAINKKLVRHADPPAPPSADSPTSQALVLFRPLPSIVPPPVDLHLDQDLNISSGHKGGVPVDSPLNPPPPSPLSSPFYVQDPGQHFFASNDDDMEIEML